MHTYGTSLRFRWVIVIHNWISMHSREQQFSREIWTLIWLPLKIVRSIGVIKVRSTMREVVANIGKLQILSIIFMSFQWISIQTSNVLCLLRNHWPILFQIPFWTGHKQLRLLSREKTPFSSLINEIYVNGANEANWIGPLNAPRARLFILKLYSIPQPHQGQQHFCSFSRSCIRAIRA